MTPPRVLVIMPDQWRRALLRAALREEGYDAIGSRGIREAFRIRPHDPDRGPLQLLIVDQDALVGAESLLPMLSERLGGPATILVKRATRRASSGSWGRVLQRPVSVADVVAAAEALLPLAPGAHRPIDTPNE
jgi:AmiR/NasT family two-component response regulator